MKTQRIKLSAMLLMTAALIFSVNLLAQEKTKKTETAEIKSSVVCGMCEERVTKELAFEKGVTDVKVNLETKVITVTYKTSKTDKETIKKAITKIGYDADDLLADDAAYEKLPACCKKDAAPH
ncbi:MAG: cation transporter [Bacteroidales bacterium]|nr:cation transporter [Bacteroidales bacterium]